MAITTYSELQTAVENYLDRTDLTSVIPDFITIAESTIRREVRTLNEEKRAYAETIAGQQELELPTDFNGMRTLFVRGTPKRALTIVSQDKLYRSHASSYTGTPEMYAVADGVLLFGPTPDAVHEIEMDYYAFAALSVSNTTNSILDRHPDLYLFLTLAQAYQYIYDDKRELKYQSKAEQVLSRIKSDDNRLRYGTAPLRTHAQQSA